jgi:NAD(P)H-hydrate epimerase
MLVSCSVMRQMEECAFARGISAEALMNQAGERGAAAVRQFFPRRGVCISVFGRGNNGGDALVAARHLAEAGWETHLVPAFPESRWNALVRKKFGEVGLGQIYADGVAGLAAAVAAWREHGAHPLVLLDGLLGTGARGPLTEPIGDLTRCLNALRESAQGQLFALDLPTGLDGDSGAADPACITADFTLTIGAAKKGLAADSATPFVGRLVVLPLDELEEAAALEAGSSTVATAPELAPLMRRRPFDTHKGEWGRIAIVAGSRGYIGAGLMSAAACVHAGAGLVTLYTLDEAYPIVAAAAAPEVMVRPVSSLLEALEARHDVLAIGPGLGQARREEILELIRQSEAPTIIDADGLNALATQIDTLTAANAPRLLTPHPGEMGRLDPHAGANPRAEVARQFVERYPVTLLLKGARTIVAAKGLPLSYNTTGNPGMASGGMGDVLTGVCAALAGQRLPLFDAARIGAWICGRAAEIAVFERGESEESLSATQVIKYLGAAFAGLRERAF